MKRTKIALALTFAFSSLFLTACHDDDDNTVQQTEKTYLSEGNYSLDTIDNSSSIKVMT